MTKLTRRTLLAAAPVFGLRAQPAESGFASVFDGRTLNGWRLVGGRGPGYVVEDGAIVCPANGGGNLFTAREYADFVLRLDWRLWEGGNNGIGIRAPLEGRASSLGMEIQVLDDESEKYKGRLKPTQYTGSIYDVFPARTGFVKRDGVWNSYEITAAGSRVKVVLNGGTVVDADLNSVTDEAVLKKHPGLRRPSGHIGFLGHGTRVEFRNIRVREV
jgi:hypothetical protein